MAHALVLGALVLILLVFVALTYIEASTGRRVLGRTREKLDTRLDVLSTKVRETSISRMLLETARTFVTQLVHEVAHIALACLRVMERALIRLVHRIQESSRARKAERHVEIEE